ncbi:hypothetical protein HELRODRAFT_189701 [Helobdella robusta]|uniref:C-type lectin domain-containing protein n=1 Tax=Helobdella robusta TaxID=6412 RepID=T1FRA0_HELRO|nr:hypothetical protein HELRODRAFT_189701 [Helobdella robusta]ESN91487.1 hypothetical protein HELRODRAFT_189701 [Helobdella robusta]
MKKRISALSFSGHRRPSISTKYGLWLVFVDEFLGRGIDICYHTYWVGFSRVRWGWRSEEAYFANFTNWEHGYESSSYGDSKNCATFNVTTIKWKETRCQLTGKQFAVNNNNVKNDFNHEIISNVYCSFVASSFLYLQTTISSGSAKPFNPSNTIFGTLIFGILKNYFYIFKIGVGNVGGHRVSSWKCFGVEEKTTSQSRWCSLGTIQPRLRGDEWTAESQHEQPMQGTACQPSFQGVQ